MSRVGPTLLLTRPTEQSKAFLIACENTLQRKLNAVISPIIDIVPTGNALDLTSVSTVVVSSANSVRLLGQKLDGVTVASVGRTTADLAKSYGATVTAVGETAAELLSNAVGLVSPILVCRGVHTRGDIAQRLSELGHSVTEVVLYDQVACDLSDEAKALLIGTGDVIAPVFSPRSAARLSEHPISAPITVVAISEATKQAWDGDARIMIAPRPTSDAVRQLVCKSF